MLLFSILLVFFLVPQLVMAAPLVPCGNGDPNPNFVGPYPNGDQPCTLAYFPVLLVNIFNFLVWSIATPLATLMIVIGAVLMLLAGINANWFTTGKHIVIWSVVAIVLIWASYLIIDTLLKVLGYNQGINPPF